MGIGSVLSTSGINIPFLASPRLCQPYIPVVERSLLNASSGSARSTTDEVEEVEEEHPKRSTVTADIPPSYSLCKQAYVIQSGKCV